ncbi:MAG: phosphatidylcholine/phosphatidylserine synthase [Bdellovibrionales bacterium]
MLDFGSEKRQDMAKPRPLKKLNQRARNIRQRMNQRIYVLPNLLTTGNLFFGFYSIVHAIKGMYLFAAYAIVAAAVFDLLDGRVARMTKSTTDFGAEYDSLCDLVSFGMAPGLLLFLWSLQDFGRIGWLAAFFYVACTALRLARFNVGLESSDKAFFKGYLHRWQQVLSPHLFLLLTIWDGMRNDLAYC